MTEWTDDGGSAGQELCETSVSKSSKSEWDELFAKFIKMAEEGISAKER